MDRFIDRTVNDVHWDQLAPVARQRNHRGRSLVPVLGAGVRGWLGLPKQFSSWKSLIRHVSKRMEVDDDHLVDPRPARQIYEPWLIGEYEALVHAFHDRRMPREQTSRAENALITEVIHPMLDASRHTKPAVHARRDELLALGFTDWIDLCIDNVFADAPPSVVPGRIGRNPHTVRVNLPNGGSSWHPHGFIQGELAATTTILGVQRYARAVSGVVTAFDQIKHFHSVNPNVDKSADLRKLDGAPMHHWVHLALNAPLLLLGVGASSEEWDLWAFLELRARAHARLPVEARPPVFRLTCDEPSEVRSRVQLATAGRVLPVRHVHGGATWEDAWGRLMGLLR
jgi:hypothetical protein